MFVWSFFVIHFGCLLSLYMFPDCAIGVQWHKPCGLSSVFCYYIHRLHCVITSLTGTAPVGKFLSVGTQYKIQKPVQPCNYLMDSFKSFGYKAHLSRVTWGPYSTFMYTQSTRTKSVCTLAVLLRVAKVSRMEEFNTYLSTVLKVIVDWKKMPYSLWKGAVKYF